MQKQLGQSEPIVKNIRVNWELREVVNSYIKK